MVDKNLPASLRLKASSDVLKCLYTLGGGLVCGKGKGWDDLEQFDFLTQTIPYFADSYVEWGTLNVPPKFISLASRYSYSELVLGKKTEIALPISNRGSRKKRGIKLIGTGETVDMKQNREYERGVIGVGVDIVRGVSLMVGVGYSQSDRSDFLQNNRHGNVSALVGFVIKR